MKVYEVRVENVVKRYKGFELRVDRLVLEPGLNLIVGPNGSGKSTLLKLIAGLARPLSGRIVYVTADGVFSADDSLELVGYVAEDVMLPDMQVYDIIEAFTRDKRQLEEIVGFLGLEKHLWKKYTALSMGLRKRVQIAIALAKDAPVVLLDEPYTNIDSDTIRVLERLFEEWRKEGRVVIIASHVEPGVVPDKLVVVRDGRVVYSGSPDCYAYDRIVVRVRVDGKVETMRLSEFVRFLEKYGIVVEDVRVTGLPGALHARCPSRPNRLASG